MTAAMVLARHRRLPRRLAWGGLVWFGMMYGMTEWLSSHATLLSPALQMAMRLVVVSALLAVLLKFGRRVTVARRLKSAAQAIRKLSMVVEQTPASVVITDCQGRIEYVNPAFVRATGYTVAEALGQNPRILKSGTMPPLVYQEMWRTLNAGGVWRGELQNRAKDGRLFWELAVISPIKDERGRVTHYVAVKEDISARKQMEDELRVAARVDRLTGLANRALLHDRLGNAIAHGRAEADYRFALLFLDLDRFKLINDSLGHHTGDIMLTEVARRVTSVVRASDSLGRDGNSTTAARIGGDEFILLLDGIRHTGDALVVAERIVRAIERPYYLMGHEIFSTASIGIVTSDMAFDRAEDMLRDADTAMYEAKMAGKGKIVLFDTPMRERVQRRLALENDLRTALDGNQFYLVYQPIVCLESGHIESVEVLLRWQHPDRGLVPPAEFIPVAEECGLVPTIGEWVLRQACRQLALWRVTAPAQAPAAISINLSRVQLMLPDLPDVVQRAMSQSHIDPASVHLEITESAVMRDQETAIQTLRKLKAIGVKLDLDDFGTGYSSLASLHLFPLDVLKLDRSFIANISRGRDFTALVHSVAQLARNMGIAVVAEGIESIDQMQILQALDCQFGQGYLFGAPMIAEQAIQHRIDVEGLRSASAA